MEPQEQDQAAKLQQIIQLATELLQGEQKETEMPDPKAGLTADIGAALSK
jgi:hypothetical protein